MDDTLWILFAVFLFGCLVGWLYREHVLIQLVREHLNEEGELTLDEAFEEENEIKTINVRIERHGDQLFVYDKEDGAFLAQGKDFFEMDDALASRFPNTKFVLPADFVEQVLNNNESI